MTRIIAGSARGNPLKVPPGEQTRPTTDRVREAFFSALATWAGGSGGAADEQLAGIRFLDLYAGSGAIGLEAASRGAREVVLVDRYRAAAEIIRRNAATAKMVDRVHVRVNDVLAFLAETPAEPFDVIWLDPPYAVSGEQLEEVLARLADGWLVSDGLVIVERANRDGPPKWPHQLAERWSRRYGETELHYARPSTPLTEEDQ